MDHSTNVHKGPNDSSCIEWVLLRDCSLTQPDDHCINMYICNTAKPSVQTLLSDISVLHTIQQLTANVVHNTGVVAAAPTPATLRQFFCGHHWNFGSTNQIGER